jgi:hypothetical protein
MPSSTRQATPGSSRTVLEPLNTKKRGLSEERNVVGRNVKKLKEENDKPAEVKDKKKRKKKKRKLPVVLENDVRSRSKLTSSASAPVVITLATSPVGAGVRHARQVLSGGAGGSDALDEDASEPVGTVESQAAPILVSLLLMITKNS